MTAARLVGRVDGYSAYRYTFDVLRGESGLWDPLQPWIGKSAPEVLVAVGDFLTSAGADWACLLTVEHDGSTWKYDRGDSPLNVPMRTQPLLHPRPGTGPASAGGSLSGEGAA